jgi:hypothetical protein
MTRGLRGCWCGSDWDCDASMRTSAARGPAKREEEEEAVVARRAVGPRGAEDATGE